MSAKGGQGYPFGYGDEELQRLGEQHRVWHEENQRLLNRAGFGPGNTLVDLGCGPGFTTLDLARRVGPMGRIIAVDRDGERSIPRLREAADAAGFGHVEARVADLEHFDLPSESVDGVYGRWVLMYLPEREARALATRIAKWLRPGGVCALAEFCNYRHIRIYPPIEHFGLVAEALMRAAAGERGGNPEIGRVLPGVLDGAGLDVELGVVTKAIRPAMQEWRWPDTLFRQILPMLVDKGLLTGEILDDFVAEWEERSRGPSAVFFSSPVLEIAPFSPRLFSSYKSLGPAGRRNRDGAPLSVPCRDPGRAGVEARGRPAGLRVCPPENRSLARRQGPFRFRPQPIVHKAMRCGPMREDARGVPRRPVGDGRLRSGGSRRR